MPSDKRGTAAKTEATPQCKWLARALRQGLHKKTRLCSGDLSPHGALEPCTDGTSTAASTCCSADLTRFEGKRSAATIIDTVVCVKVAHEIKMLLITRVMKHLPCVAATIIDTV